MKKLTILWKHLAVDGDTCERCADTGETIATVVAQLRSDLLSRGVEIAFERQALDGASVSESNSLFLNGVPLEDIAGLDIRNNYCASCSDLLGKETYCRTILFEGAEYETIPAVAIRKAAEIILGIGSSDSHRPTESKPCRCCKKGGCC